MSVFEVRGGNDRRSMIKRYERKSKQEAIRELVDLVQMSWAQIEQLDALLESAGAQVRKTFKAGMPEYLCAHCGSSEMFHEPGGYCMQAVTYSTTTAVPAPVSAPADGVTGTGPDITTKHGYPAYSVSQHHRIVAALGAAPAHPAERQEPLHVTHRPLIRNAINLLRMRQPVAPDVERVAADLEAMLDGQQTPAGEPSGAWLKVAEQVDQQEDLHVWRATTRFGETCHFGEASTARAWAGEYGTVERVDLTPVPELRVVERHDQPEVQRLREALEGMLEYFPEGASDGECFAVDAARAALSAQQSEPERVSVPVELLERITRRFSIRPHWDSMQQGAAIAELRAMLTEQPQASAAQSAPAGEREAFDKWFRAEQLIADHIDTTFISSAFLPYKAFQAGASWQRTQAAGVTMQQVLIAYDYATDHPHKHLRGTTNWCAAFAHSLNEQLAAAPAQPAAQEQGEVQRRERWTVTCGHWQDTTLAIHGERTGHIASGIDEDAAHAIVNAHNQGMPPIAAASTGQEVEP